MRTIGIVDTTFASVDMGGIAERTLKAHATGIRIERSTVPGLKDLAVASKRLLDAGCDIVVACGMPGPEPIDKQTAHVASTGLQFAQVLAGKHILEIFVHLDEAKDAKELVAVAENRVAEHALNALALLAGPRALASKAGTGQRQGFKDVGAAESLAPDIDVFAPRTARAAAGHKLGASGGAGGGAAGKH